MTSPTLVAGTDCTIPDRGFDGGLRNPLFKGYEVFLNLPSLGRRGRALIQGVGNMPLPHLLDGLLQFQDFAVDDLTPAFRHR